MTFDRETSPAFLGLSPATAAILLIAVSTIFRLFYASWLPLLPDEAYYLQWAKHLDASYISKGPAVAYTIAAGTALFGTNNLGVRFFAVLLAAGTAWQIFLLARRWYDDVTGLIAVLVTSVVPIYAIGAVVMTIDPLSVFFWVWAANCFSGALRTGRSIFWALTGFAVGCGFLAKYLNALELISFVSLLLLMPERRRLLARPGFWLMIAVAVLCTAPVVWWNTQHGWLSLGQLLNRGHLNGAGPFRLQASTFVDFLGGQILVMSPFLFVALLASIGIAIGRRFRRADGVTSEGELLLVLLFAPVFVMYLVLSWHLRCEPNWPAVSYLSLIVVLASHWRKMLLVRPRSQPFIVLAFGCAWLQTLLMQDTTYLPLPAKLDPMSRVAGWESIARHLEDLRHAEHAPDIITDAYKEASIFSFYLPGHDFVYALRHSPPANQYDLWGKYPTREPALWITGEPNAAALRPDFRSIVFLEHDVVFFRGKAFREYDVYLCSNAPPSNP